MAQISSLTQFTNGISAQAPDVNANLETLRQGHNAHDTRLDTLETETRPVDEGGTGLASYTVGDTLYASGATTIAKLAKGTALQYYRMNSGTTAPEWATIYTFKEYGLTLSHSGGNIAVAAGARWDDTYTEKLEHAGGTLTVGTLTSASPATRYYIFVGKDASGDETFEKDTNSDGSGLSTITGTKTCIGEFYAQVSSTSIDTTILVTYHADGTKTYDYTQASGSFPTATTAIPHGLNTKKIIALIRAIRNADSEEFNLMTGNSPDAYDPLHIDTVNAINVQFVSNFIVVDSDGTVATIQNSADYSLKVIIKTLL